MQRAFSFSKIICNSFKIIKILNLAKINFNFIFFQPINRLFTNERAIRTIVTTMSGNQNRNRNQYDDYQRNFSRSTQRQQFNNFEEHYAQFQDSIQQANNYQQMNNYRQIPETVFTVHCGEIRPKDESVKVKISGKVFKRPNSSRFLEIKDVRGCTQLVANDDRPEIQQKFQSIPSDAYISVIGTVQLRPNRFINKVKKTTYLFI